MFKGRVWSKKLRGFLMLLLLDDFNLFLIKIWRSGTSIWTLPKLRRFKMNSTGNTAKLIFWKERRNLISNSDRLLSKSVSKLAKKVQKTIKFARWMYHQLRVLCQNCIKWKKRKCKRNIKQSRHICIRSLLIWNSRKKEEERGANQLTQDLTMQQN